MLRMYLGISGKDEFRDLCSRAGLAVDESLDLVGPQTLQDLKFFCYFHAFGDHVQSCGGGPRGDCFHNRLVLRIHMDVLDETAIDF